MLDGTVLSTIRASEAAVSTVADVVRRLEADPGRGLASTEVEQRRTVHGFNEFQITEEEPLWRKYLNQVGTTAVLSRLLLQLLTAK